MNPKIILTCFLLTFASFAVAQEHDYGKVLRMSLLFYEAQRSGKLPPHNRIPWRYDSALDDEIVGGYYDAGDHVKFGFPMAAMTTQMAWGGISFRKGFELAGQVDNLKDAVQWATDYFIQCNKEPFNFVAQIGDGKIDHSFWGRARDMNTTRPTFRITKEKPGTEVTAETSAALSAASVLFKNLGHNQLAKEALKNARSLFEFANNYRGDYSDSIPEVNDFYNSWSGYKDELVWAAVWLAKASGSKRDLSKAEKLYKDLAPSEGSIFFDWDRKTPAIPVLLYEMTKKAEYRAKMDDFVTAVLEHPDYTPRGLIFVNEWGTLRHAANLSHLLLQIARLGIRRKECIAFAKRQIGYALGDNNAEKSHSFVVGYGKNPPKRYHHRGASCPDVPLPCGQEQLKSPDPNPQVLFGALVGGPNKMDEWVDDREDFMRNEVATDYNAGFQSALAALNAMYE